jgi:hypothetical protein
MKLIFCLGGNKKYPKIARSFGWWMGARLPTTLYPEYFPLAFTDQNWLKYKQAKLVSKEKANLVRHKYMKALEQHKPYMASVIDWEEKDEFFEVLDWAEEAAFYVQKSVMIIPKVPNFVDMIPDKILNMPVVLGYSIPTRHGGTSCSIEEFNYRNVHFLGSSPQKQINTYNLFQKKSPNANIVSADSNSMQIAARFGNFFNGYTWEYGGRSMDINTAIGLSFKNYMDYWEKINVSIDKCKDFYE